MPAMKRVNRILVSDLAANEAASGALPAAGSTDEPRTQEALQLMVAFLAIEGEQACAALITPAERFVSYDWVHKSPQR